MKEYTKDTSASYDDLVGYVAEDNLPTDLSEFMGEQNEYKPKVEPKKVNPDFPEEWQQLYVNFDAFDTYAEFMAMIGQVPLPKLKELVFTTDNSNSLEKFF